jgi:hypothetical protein
MLQRKARLATMMKNPSRLNLSNALAPALADFSWCAATLAIGFEQSPLRKQRATKQQRRKPWIDVPV